MNTSNNIFFLNTEALPVKNSFNDNLQYLYCTFITMTRRRVMGEQVRYYIPIPANRFWTVQHKVLPWEFAPWRDGFWSRAHWADPGRTASQCGSGFPRALLHTGQIIYQIQFPVRIRSCSAKKKSLKRSLSKSSAKVKTTTVLLCPFLKSGLIFLCYGL